MKSAMQPAPGPPEAHEHEREEAYVDGHPFTSPEDERSAICDARRCAPLVLEALRERMGDSLLQHCQYPCGSLTITTPDDAHLGLAPTGRVAEFTVHRAFGGLYDVVFFGGQPRTTLVGFGAEPTRLDVSVGLRARVLLQRDVDWCEADLMLEPEQGADGDGSGESDDDDDDGDGDVQHPSAR